MLNEELEGGECFWIFYFSWIEGILIPCLRTRLRDQIHRSSLPKMFLFLLVDFKLKMGFWRIERGLKGMRLGNCEVELVICKRSQIWLSFIEIWLRKWKKGKFNGILIPRFIMKSVWVMLFIFFGKWFFLSINPRHSSKHTILNIHLNMHILAISKCEVCACVGACVGVHY